MEFSRPEYWSGQPFPSPGDLPNPGVLHCRQILYHLSHKQSPRTLEWVAYPFSSRSSWPRNQTRVFCIAGGFFTNRAIRKALLKLSPFTSWNGYYFSYLAMNDNSRFFKCLFLKNRCRWTSSETQWLRQGASKCRRAGDANSIPGQRIKIPNAALYSTANKYFFTKWK